MSHPDRNVVTPRLAAILAAVNALAVTAAPAQQLYVDDDAPPGGDGRSWDTAFRDLQDALDIARNPEPWGAFIYIAQGTYAPDRGTLDRDASFMISSAVTLIGGFAGIGAPDPGAHDHGRFVSVLSGDLRRDDEADFQNRTDNARHVVRSDGNGGGSLNYLTIRGGYADGNRSQRSDRGGGIGTDIGSSSRLAINHCDILDNFATGGGAGAFIGAGGVQIYKAVVADNKTDGSGLAAGIVSHGPASVHLCRFAGNLVGSDDTLSVSALFAPGDLSLSTCVIDANDPARPAVHADGAVSISGSTFTNNNDGSQPTLLLGSNARAHIEGSIFFNNLSSPIPREVFISGENARLRVTSSLIRGGTAGISSKSAAIEWNSNNIDSDPMFVNPAGADGNTATWRDNDYSLVRSSPCVDAGSYLMRWNGEDFLGNVRWVNTLGGCQRRADIGAFEYQSDEPLPPPVRVYVKSGAAGGDGRSWENAYATLNEALLAPGVREIWITSGVYSPDQGSISRLDSFVAACDIDIIGGFRGDETEPAQRDPSANPTILTGDLLRNDDDTAASRDDNSEVVFVAVQGSVVLDGLTIERSHTRDSSSAALLANMATLSMRNCTIQLCTGVGGAVRAKDCNVTLQSCVIRDNDARGEYWDSGAAMYFSGPYLDIFDSVFTGNRVTSLWSGPASALKCAWAERARIVSSSFSHNIAAEYQSIDAGTIDVRADELEVVNSRFVANESIGADDNSYVRVAVANFSASDLSVVGCLFAENVVALQRVAMGVVGFRAIERSFIINNTIAANEFASRYPTASAMYVSYGDEVIVANNILWENGPSTGEAAPQIDSDNAFILNNCIQGWDGSIFGIGNFSADPLFIGDGDFRLSPGSPCIDAAYAAVLPADIHDLDHDGDTTEHLPVDIVGGLRIAGPALDLGAYESAPHACAADYNTDSRLDSQDFFAFLNDFFLAASRADFNRDGVVNSGDFFSYMNAFFAGCA